MVPILPVSEVPLIFTIVNDAMEATAINLSIGTKPKRLSTVRNVGHYCSKAQKRSQTPTEIQAPGNDVGKPCHPSTDESIRTGRPSLTHK